MKIEYLDSRQARLKPPNGPLNLREEEDKGQDA